MTTVVLVCGDGPAVTDESIRGASAQVHTIPELCSHPRRLVHAVADADRLVLVLCPGNYDLGNVQSHVRKAGLDPFGVEIIELSGTSADPERTTLLVEAAVACATAFEGSNIAATKPVLHRDKTRRSLFTLPPPEYLVVPTTDSMRCAAGVGCDICVDPCPQQAIRIAHGRVERDIVACEPCGICVAVCPAQATTDSTVTSTQLFAQIGVLVDTTIGPAGPRGIAFVCSRATERDLPESWYPVFVPCTGMVTSPWLLGALGQGADGVVAVPCYDSGCSLNNDARLHAEIEFGQAFLAAAGARSALIGATPFALGDAASAPLAVESIAATNPYHGVPGPILLAIARAADAVGDFCVDHRASPLGLVNIDESACTLCEACVYVCPAGALIANHREAQLEVALDPNRCVGCKQCVRTCPERAQGAIDVRTVVDVGALDAGSRTLVRDATLRCARCESPIAALALVRVLRERLGPDNDAAAQIIGRYCARCRGGAPLPMPGTPRSH